MSKQTQPLEDLARIAVDVEDDTLALVAYWYEQRGPYVVLIADVLDRRLVDC